MRKRIKDEPTYVYVDYTTDDGRPFYVGLGAISRVNDVRHRTKLWKNIANKHGHVRKIVFETENVDEACLLEIKLIAEYKTFAADHPSGVGWGANLSRGGEGPVGFVHTSETRERMRQLKLGTRHSEESKAKISAGTSGENNPMFGLHGENHPAYGYKHTEESRAKFTGEKNASAKFTQEVVNEIRRRYAAGDVTQTQLAEEFNSTQAHIGKIINFKLWSNGNQPNTKDRRKKENKNHGN